MPAPDVVVVGTLEGTALVDFCEYFRVEELLCFEKVPIDWLYLEESPFTESINLNFI